MGEKNQSDLGTGTIIDSLVAQSRLKEGLIPANTSIFLRVEQGPEAGRAYDLSAGGVYLIGRVDADIALDDEKVSRKHAELGLYGTEAYVLRDLASTNGTFVNGKRLADRVKLNPGDLIRLGDTLLAFSVTET